LFGNELRETPFRVLEPLAKRSFGNTRSQTEFGNEMKEQTIAFSSLIPHSSSLYKDSPFFVPPFLDLLGWSVDRFREFWLGVGRLESARLEKRLNSVSVRMPVYVCGLARSGSTLLHEIAASASGVATHRVKDYPMVYTPYWWRQATARWRPTAPRER